MSFTEQLELINADIERNNQSTFERLLGELSKELIELKFNIMESNNAN